MNEEELPLCLVPLAEYAQKNILINEALCLVGYGGWQDMPRRDRIDVYLMHDGERYIFKANTRARLLNVFSEEVVSTLERYAVMDPGLG